MRTGLVSCFLSANHLLGCLPRSDRLLEAQDLGEAMSRGIRNLDLSPSSLLVTTCGTSKRGLSSRRIGFLISKMDLIVLIGCCED